MYVYTHFKIIFMLSMVTCIVDVHQPYICRLLPGNKYRAELSNYMRGVKEYDIYIYI